MWDTRSGTTEKTRNTSMSHIHCQEAESLSVLREEVEEAVHNPKAEKTPGVENVLSELRMNGGETTTVLTVICQKIWETRMAS